MRGLTVTLLLAAVSRLTSGSGCGECWCVVNTTNGEQCTDYPEPMDYTGAVELQTTLAGQTPLNPFDLQCDPYHDDQCNTVPALPVGYDKDLASYMAVFDMTSAGKQCGVESLLSFRLGVECYMGLGLTEPCANIWTYDSLKDSEVCKWVCAKGWRDPYNVPPSCELNDCLQCDEDQAGPLFQQFGGRTRRRSGLESAIQRPCETVAVLSHEACPGR